jgi:hypothetical protein
VALDVLNVVELGSEGVVDVDDEDLPVGLTLVEESHDTEDLDLLDGTDGADRLTDLANVEGVVVTVGLGLGVLVRGVLPGLGEGTVGESERLERVEGRGKGGKKKKRKGKNAPVVPDVTLVGEAVADETELALLGVLKDGVELVLLRDLKLGVGPAGDLDDHVEDGALLVGVEGDIVEGRDNLAVLLEEDTVVCSVESGREEREEDPR